MASVDMGLERAVRLAAMAYVRQCADANVAGVISRDELEAFTYDGERIKLLDTAKGIRNPNQLAATLTIMTSLRSPYEDTFGPEGMLRYAIQGDRFGAGENRKLHRAYELGLPLIWFHMVRTSVFVPLMPVYLVDEEPELLRYVVALDDDQRLMAPRLLLDSELETTLMDMLPERRYVARMTRQRLHQPAFRAGVILAYDVRCAVCSLPRGSLLDAAHIIPDGDPGGDPVVANGLALCKIHHAAYDQSILGVDARLGVHINADVLVERDGPMLRHGLQEFHGRTLQAIPRRKVDRPDPWRLSVRFERFLAAG